jgi:phosphoribosylformylglycinamidine synthase
MESVCRFAAAGGLVLGICNGFQILCESGLLPGVLMRNQGLKYISKAVQIRCENPDTAFTNQCTKGEVLTVPIGHMEGNYFCDDDTLRQLREQKRIIFRYCSPAGEVTRAANPNGALDNIAGICNEGFNVLGMMPHPERASEPALGMTDGIKILQSLVNAGVLKS